MHCVFLFVIGFLAADSLHASVSETWRQLLEEGKGVRPGRDFGLTWGAEKEGSSAILTRVASPSGATLRDFAETLSPENKALFLRHFFLHYRRGGDYSVEGEVRALDGKLRRISWQKISLEDIEGASLEALEEAWESWIAMTDDSPFSFLSSKARRGIFEGTLPGLSQEGFRTRRFYFDKPWKPILGVAERYIEGVYKDGRSWEIHFWPQASYGDFEEMIRWFRKELKTDGELFRPPGHQRMVFPQTSGFKREKAFELFKVLQALIVVNSLERESDISESAVAWKKVHADADEWGERGILRVEPRRWGEGHFGVEFRRGMVSAKLARFVLTVFASRVIENSWDDLEDATSWVLVNPWPYDLLNLGGRFGVDRQMVRWARHHWERHLPEFHHLYYAPLWNWQDAPFLSSEKKQHLRELSKKFVQQSAAIPMGRKKMLGIVAHWVRQSEIMNDLKAYAAPDCPQLVREIL